MLGSGSGPSRGGSRYPLAFGTFLRGLLELVPAAGAAGGVVAGADVGDPWGGVSWASGTRRATIRPGQPAVGQSPRQVSLPFGAVRFTTVLHRAHIPRTFNAVDRPVTCHHPQRPLHPAVKHQLATRVSRYD